MSLNGIAGASLLAMAAGLMGLGQTAEAQQIIRVDGSSTVYPVTEAVAEEFQKANPGTKVTVGISGTGGGFKKFVRGEIDISDASRPILAKEMEEAAKNGIEYIELPVAFDALTVMINPRNNFAATMTVEELKKIWEPDAQGKISKWNQVRPEWPDAPLKLYGAGADSGTFDYFTEAIVGKAKSSRGDFTASEDDNVLVQGIASDVNALGFFGYAYYAENKDKLKAVAISEKGAPAQLPSEETVLKGTYQPLSRPIFIYVSKKSLERPEVMKFVEFYLREGPALAKEVKYVPLPADAYQKGLERVKQRSVGTAFGGHSEVGLQIDELFKRELTSKPKAAAGAGH
jgi:phosphate transport system substrate-binding protein